MTAEIILKHIPSKYSNLQIEASLILAFLRQKQLDGINHSQLLTDILCYAEPEICEIITRVSNDNLSLKLLENVFEALVEDCEKRENGVVFTPCYIVEYILENTLDDQLADDSIIIDPACGSGAFLVLAAEKLSQKLNKSISETISHNIFGIDLSEDNVRRTKELLTLLVLSNGETADLLRFNIKAANSLKENERANIKKIEQSGFPIKPYIRVGIATLRDNVYLIDGFDQEERMYYKLFEGTRYLIEPGITRSIYKVSNIKAESSLADAKQAIIFPYTEIEQYSLVDAPNKNYQIIPEHIMSQCYPQCYQYLCRCRTILDGRDKGKGNAVAWYAYGRSQGLGNNGRKLLFPTFSLHPKFMLEDSRQTLFCNGYAILEPPQFDLEILQKILNSIVMDYYVSKTSYAIEGNYKCYQKKYIQRFSVPQFTDDELTYLKNEPDMSSINQFLIEKYGLSDFRA